MLCWCLPEDISISLSVLEYSLSNVSQSLASFYLLNKPKSGYKYFVEPYRTFGAHTHLLQWSWFWGMHFFKVKKYTVYTDWIDLKILFRRITRYKRGDKKKLMLVSVLHTPSKLMFLISVLINSWAQKCNHITLHDSTLIMLIPLTIMHRRYIIFY